MTLVWTCSVQSWWLPTALWVSLTGGDSSGISEHSLIQIMNLKLSSRLTTLTLHSQSGSSLLLGNWQFIKLIFWIIRQLYVCMLQVSLLSVWSFLVWSSAVREDLKFEKTHLLYHYQAGAAYWAPGGAPANTPVCHLQTTRSRPNDVAMMDTHSGISQTDQHPGHV